MKIKLKCKDCKMKDGQDCLILKYLKQYLEEDGPYLMTPFIYDWSDCKILMMEVMAKAAVNALENR